MNRGWLRLLPLWLLLLATPALAELRPRGPALVFTQASGSELELLLQARVRAEVNTESGPAPPAKLHSFASWTPEGDGLVSELSLAPTGLNLVVRVAADASGRYTMRMTARATAATWAGEVALVAAVASRHAVVGGRDLHQRSLGRKAALSGLDPKWLILSPDDGRSGQGTAWTVVVDDDADGIKVARLKNRVQLQVDLLSTEARPFSHFIDCTDNWHAPNKRLPLPTRLMLSDETQAATLIVYSGGATPLFKARYPEGRNAAFVITDHADQTAAPTLRALAGGTSDVSSPHWGKGGLLGNGLHITKALWMSSGEPAPPPLGHDDIAELARLHHASAHPQHSRMSFRQRFGRPQVDATGGGRPQLDDPEVAGLADQLAKSGWEIIPHSATPLRDERDRTRAALDYFSRFSARTWIDHQPYTNCEALINRGYQNGPFGILDLLAEYGYRYAWSGIDVSPGTLNLLSPKRQDRYVPVLWPAGRLAEGTPVGPWLFSSMMMYVDNVHFFKLYNKHAVDQLERERGLHIAHTYLEAFHPPTSTFVNRNLMIPGKRPAEVVTSPKLEELFASLAARVARGSLWVPTLAQLGDHLRAMLTVTVRLEADGSATLRSPAALTNATFVLPRGKTRVFIDGQPAKGVRHDHGETSFWLDLPENRPVRVTFVDENGQAVNLLHAPPPPKSLLAGIHGSSISKQYHSPR